MIMEIFNSNSTKYLKEILNICFNRINVTQKLSSEIDVLFNVIENPFKIFNLHTEFRRITFFNNSKKFIVPVKHNIGQSPSNVKVKGQIVMILKDHTSITVPLRETLKMFLELPNVFQKIMNYIEQCNNNVNISSLLQCSLWKSIKNRYPDKIVLPIILYYDDFQCGNPLGSHASVQKLGALYFAIGALPPEYSSRLENIFLASLFLYCR